MARIIILVLIIASVAMFVLILKVPTGMFFTPESVAPTASAPTSAKAKPRAGLRKNTAVSPDKAGSSPEMASPQPLPDTGVEDAMVNAARGPATRAQTRETEWSVASDTAHVYSTNSSAGAVLQTLKKGDVVKTNLEVLAGNDRWILVDLRDRNGAGFIRQNSVSRNERPAFTP